MANEKNLIPLNRRSKEEAKKIQKRGGEARGAQRREQRTARLIVNELMNRELTTKDGKKITYKDALLSKMSNTAFETLDLQMIKYLFELNGEAPTQQVDVTSGGRSLSTKSKKELIDRIKQIEDSLKK